MKHTGGGWYELSNGEKVRGKANAEAAEAQLTGASDGDAEVSRYGAPYAAVVNQEPTDPNISRYGSPYAEVVQS